MRWSRSDRAQVYLSPSECCVEIRLCCRATHIFFMQAPFVAIFVKIINDCHPTYLQLTYNIRMHVAVAQYRDATICSSNTTSWVLSATLLQI